MFYIIAAIIVLWIVACIGEPAKERVQRGLAMVPDFTPGVTFSHPNDLFMLAIDPTTERIVLIRNAREMMVYGFDEIVSVEIARDGQSLQRTNRGSQVMGAAVGAALLGPVGLLVGGVTGSRRTTEKVKHLSLKVYTNDVHCPVQEIVFFHQSAGLSPDSAQVRLAAQQLDEWYGRFLTILRGQRQGAHNLTPNEATTATPAFGRRRPLIASQ